MKDFKELSTIEIIELTELQIQNYCDNDWYDRDFIDWEIDNCKNIRKKMWM